MKNSAEHEAYTFIRKAIISRHLLPNEQIVEQYIVEKSGVSRTPIRAALKRLENEGLVVLKPNRGAFVVNPSRKDVRDLFECKMLLELEMVSLVTPCITDEQIDRLCEIQNLTVMYHQQGIHENFLELNYDFHMIIAQASDSDWIVKLSHELLTATNAALLVYDDFREVPLEDMESFKEHNEIIDSLRSRDAVRVKKAVYQHLLNTYETLRLNLPLRICPSLNLTDRD